MVISWLCLVIQGSPLTQSAMPVLQVQWGQHKLTAQDHSGHQHFEERKCHRRQICAPSTHPRWYGWSQMESNGVVCLLGATPKGWSGQGPIENLLQIYVFTMKYNSLVRKMELSYFLNLTLWRNAQLHGKLIHNTNLIQKTKIMKKTADYQSVLLRSVHTFFGNAHVSAINSPTKHDPYG